MGERRDAMVIKDLARRFWHRKERCQPLTGVFGSGEGIRRGWVRREGEEGTCWHGGVGGGRSGCKDLHVLETVPKCSDGP
ncbi:hypothetical protein PoB_004436100 [Plakobranchus ocellatus]|uniref:Uncharacterized protein n=1 Tax=Plakobranchus ocellatus TaxID=259542 RepID=A0AAV4BBQ3_9GAST|nr:hypothetical protein PoB_004436100 [Plakobranchus ocellatus]